MIELPERKALIFLSGEIKTPPFSAEARQEAGDLLRQVQEGIKLSMPHSRPLPELGRNCHELRVRDQNVNWRIIYRVDPDAVLIAAVFAKKTQALEKRMLAVCKQRFAAYDRAVEAR
ncbi:MAG TPA: type II toxin-antitoxin system RelE/ParE family toxin [Longimicrobium sp.]|jgi:phage-related protein